MVKLFDAKIFIDGENDQNIKAEKYLKYFSRNGTCLLEARCPTCINKHDIRINKESLNSYIKINFRPTKRNIEKHSPIFYCGECAYKSKVLNMASYEISKKNLNLFCDLFFSPNTTNLLSQRVSFSRSFKNLYLKRSREEKITILKYARRIKYDDFLKTPYWHTVRRIIKIENGMECHECGLLPSNEMQFDVHHLDYKYLGCELMGIDKMEVLCHSCHAVRHAMDDH